MNRNQTIDQFAKKMEKFAKGIDPTVTGIVQRTTLSVAEELIQDTPVDTGKARSNWQVSLPGELSPVIGPHSPGRHLGKKEQLNKQIALLLAKIKIYSVLKNAKSLSIQNNVDYIRDLNEIPSSQQSPAGFVERAIVRGVRRANAKIDLWEEIVGK